MSAIFALNAALDRRATRQADLVYARYVGPAGVGLHYVQLVGSSVQIAVLSGTGSTTYAPGELVALGNNSGRGKRFLAGAAPAGGRGSGAFPASSSVFAADAVLISAAYPETVAPAATVDVDIFGYGFRPAEDSWDVVVLPVEPALDPLAVDTAATILSVAALDALAEGYTLAPGQVAVRLSLEVAADAAPGHGLSFRVQRASAVNVAPDLLRVELPDVPPEPDHYGFVADFFVPELALDLYLGGTPSERFAAVESPYVIEDTPTAAIPIRTSPVLGSQSVAWRAGGPGSSEAPRLHAIDSTDDSLKTWNPAAGYDCSPAVLGLDERLWWVEFQSGTTAGACTIRIWSSPADLSAPSEEFSGTLPNPGVEEHAVICPRITELHLYFGWTVGGDVANTYADYQFPVEGGSLVDRTTDWDTGHDGIGPGSNPTETNVGAHGVLAGDGNGCSYVLGGSVWFQDKDGTPPVLAFPLAEPWSLGGELSVDWLPGVGVLAYSKLDALARRGPVIAAEDDTPLENINIGSTGAGLDAFFYRMP